MESLDAGILISKIKTLKDRVNFMREVGNYLIFYFRSLLPFESWLGYGALSGCPKRRKK
jgi:hypothetical protein